MEYSLSNCVEDPCEIISPINEGDLKFTILKNITRFATILTVGKNFSSDYEDGYYVEVDNDDDVVDGSHNASPY